MGVLRLYKTFYCIGDAGGTGETYVPITPTTLSAATYVSGTGYTPSTTLIEAGVTLVEEKPGMYYADLTPDKYSSDVTYDLAWYVQYTPEAPDKRLTTRFRIKPINVAGQLDFEISDVHPIEYEILGTYN